MLTNTLNFNNWPLHDAPINSFLIRWKEGECHLTLSIFENPGDGKNAIPCKIIWQGITLVEIPAELPWGHSIFINRQSFNNEKEYIIEMQSGDEIKIIAEKIEVVKL